jgi:hypothetical protein
VQLGTFGRKPRLLVEQVLIRFHSDSQHFPGLLFEASLMTGFSDDSVSLEPVWSYLLRLL